MRLGFWFTLLADGAQLGSDVQKVIALRAMKIAGGGRGAQMEVARMLTEKVAAVAEAAAILTRGGSGQKVVRRYRARVTANLRRLSRNYRGASS
jgi:hypothetical protein